MAQCQGTTKSGARCKRNVAEGIDYCSAHRPEEAARAGSSKKNAGADTAGPTAQEEGARTTSGERHVSSGEDLLHLAIGVAVTVAMFWLLKRGPRFPGL